MVGLLPDGAHLRHGHADPRLVDQLELASDAQQATGMLTPDRAAALVLVDELLVGLVEVEAGFPALPDKAGDIEALEGAHLLHVVADAEQGLALTVGDLALELGHVAEEIVLLLGQAWRGQQQLGQVAYANVIVRERLHFSPIQIRLLPVPRVCTSPDRPVRISRNEA